MITQTTVIHDTTLLTRLIEHSSWRWPRLLLLLASILFGMAELDQSVSAQESINNIDQLAVDFWPDYDQASVLVLATITLPSDIDLPATVTLPLPQEATLNAVARVDEAGGMFTDIEYDDSVPGRLEITSTAPRIRLEYYTPYEAEGSERSFSFLWRSDLAVDEIVASVQQPAVATGMTLAPPAASVTTGGDGLQYHHLPVEEIPAGVAYTIDATYTMSSEQLTAEFQAQRDEAASGQNVLVPLSEPPSSEESSQFLSDFNWPLALAIMGGLLFIAAIVWFFLGGRQASRVTKPRPARQTSASRKSRPTSAGKETGPGAGAKFCHECGQQLDREDRFCRNCGTQVKTT